MIKKDENISRNETEEIKVKIRLKSVGNAPILKKNRYFIDRALTVSYLKAFLAKQLQLTGDIQAQLFLYCQSSFQPLPMQTVGSLYEMFKENTSGELIIDYSLTNAYG